MIKSESKMIKTDSTGLAERDRRYTEVLRTTRDPRRAVASYCQGNKWLTENARAVGNMK